MKHSNSISKRLLFSVLSVYFVLTFLVTCVQIVAEYRNTKSYISNELQTLENTFSASLTRAIWELNTAQVVSISEGLIAIPMIEGIVIRDDTGALLTQKGVVPKQAEYTSELASEGTFIETDDSLFGYQFPLIFQFSNRNTLVGDVRLYSSRDVVVDRIILSIYFMLGSALFKTTFLILLFLMAFRKHLTDPLEELVEQIEKVDLDNLEDSSINVKKIEGSELIVIQESFNKMMARFWESQIELKQTQKKLLNSNDMLDQQNLLLEQEVAKKTANLSQAMMDLQKQKYQLETKQNELKQEIENRTLTETRLVEQTHELEQTIENLRLAHGKLVESEKLAALGGLVAGITHDVNTPIGVGVTAASVLAERLKTIDTKLHNQSLSAADMKNFLAESNQSVELLLNNLQRASELIASFKQIAVDQASEANRQINIKDYLQEIVISLKPELKKANHCVNINCPDDLVIELPAGAVSQVFTNFIINSVIHGFVDIREGQINITVEDKVDLIEIEYSDNGKGVSEDELALLFEPFYTTRRDNGGSGLGTNIAYNLVKQTLKGEITATSKVGEGLTYRIKIPKIFN